MAKLDRNRGKFFGSWTGKAIAEACKAITNGTGVTAATVTAATFGKAVSVSGEYVFTYSGDAWKYNGTTVELDGYGIKVTGEPASGDTITVTYTAASGGWEALGKDND